MKRAGSETGPDQCYGAADRDLDVQNFKRVMLELSMHYLLRHEQQIVKKVFLLYVLFMEKCFFPAFIHFPSVKNAKIR